MVEHVIITGGAEGIGAATALHLVAQGKRVSIVDRSSPEVSLWWKTLPAHLRGTWAVADASDPEEFYSAVHSAIDDGISGLVACAGVSLKESFLESTIDAWETTLRVNLLGTVQAIKAVSSALSALQRPGSIVTLGSTAAFGAVNGLGAHYHASKGAIVSLTKALASELAPRNIRVNAVIPGVVRTPMTSMMRERHSEEKLTRSVPLRVIAEAEEVAQVISWLLSTEAEMVTGHCLPADAGQLSVVGHPGNGFPELEYL